MATFGDVKTRAQAEAPSCCGQQMQLQVGSDTTHFDFNVAYKCGNCANTTQGRLAADIADDLNYNKPMKGAEVRVSPEVLHNTALLKRLLAGVQAVLHVGSDHLDKLAARNGVLAGQVAEAGEFAVRTQQTDRSKQALDETNGVVVGMEKNLGGMSSSVVTAEDSITAALAALRAVELAEDILRQAGAGPQSVAPARDGA